MAEHRALRLLVVEDNPADERFLRDLLEEAAATGVWPTWMPWRTFFVDTAAEACDLAIDGAFDSILLNLSLPDAPSLYQAFHEVRSVAAATPTLILADEPDDALESALLREGAQDFLVKATLDPEPLARALKRAVERQRHVNALTPAEGPETIATLPEVHEAESDEVLIKLIGAGVLASAETGVVSGE